MDKVLKNDVDYEAAMAELERLAEGDPSPESPAGERLELLSLLVRDYEAKRFPNQPPDPIEAIRFRMDQAGLSQRDLIPFIGSRSKVSEVLARKRPLTLSMIRSLHRGLGIPAQVLLQDKPPDSSDEDQVDWDRFPVKEIVSRGWVQPGPVGVRENAESIVRTLFAPLGSLQPAHALYKRTRFIRSGRTMDKYALTAWSARILVKGKDLPGAAQSMKREFLDKRGIALVIEKHLPRTHLDGAALILESGRPVVGLALRHNRLDNFWFCLMHELAHIVLHLNDSRDGFYDDLDSDDKVDSREREADDLAREVLVPRMAWESSPARHLRSPEAAQHLAERLRIHPSIVAGRMRFESGNYRVLNSFVGAGEVRKCFTNTGWASE